MDMKAFTMACVEYFGTKENQSKMAMAKEEVMKLTYQDKLDLKPGLEKALGCAINLAPPTA